jgi:hypothetical protein
MYFIYPKRMIEDEPNRAITIASASLPNPSNETAAISRRSAKARPKKAITATMKRRALKPKPAKPIFKQARQ